MSKHQQVNPNFVIEKTMECRNYISNDNNNVAIIKIRNQKYTILKIIFQVMLKLKNKIKKNYKSNKNVENVEKMSKTNRIDKIISLNVRNTKKEIMKKKQLTKTKMEVKKLEQIF